MYLNNLELNIVAAFKGQNNLKQSCRNLLIHVYDTLIFELILHAYKHIMCCVLTLH